MYCENCGKKIDEDAIFCEHCGNKLKETAINITVEKKKKELSQENKIILAILCIIGFVFLFFLELKYFNSPDNAIHNYLKNWENKNYDNLLADLKIEESKFTNKEIFSKVYPDLNEFKMTDFKVTGCEMKKNKNQAICHVSFKTENHNFTYEKDYVLEKKEKNRLILFTNWEIIQTNIKTLSDVLIYLPTGAKAFLMEQNLEEYLEKEELKKGYDCYKIPLIFQGTYPLKIILENGMSLEKKITIKNKEYTYHFNLKDASQELTDEMEKLGKDVIETIYLGAIEKKEFQSLNSIYKIEELKNTYDKFKKELENTGLTKFQINEIKLTNIKMLEEGNIYLSFRADYTYEIKEGENVYKKESNDSFYITINNIDKKEILKIESLVTYFRKK